MPQLRSQNFARHSVFMATDDMQHDRQARALLAEALKRSGKSARKAAEGMAITDTRLRHIINGYQPVGRGQKIEVHAPTDTMADIALALGVDPDAMERAGRVDVARAMHARMRDQSGSPGDREWSRILAEHEEIREWADEGIEVSIPPDSLLRMFDDTQLLAEILRRMRQGSDFAPVDDVNRPVGSVTTEELWDQNLSVLPDRPDLAIASDEQGDIAGEQVDRNDP